ncbi:MAG: hypothetical protein HQL56_13485 [Magnetococcales bacterium]|nr:hypothetical protein [Magnetococcales bacterium]
MIVSSELKLYPSQVRNDTSGNGGRMATTAIADSVINNVLPNVSEAERAAGITRYRKLFRKVANADNLPLTSARLFIAKPTQAGDRVTIFPATQTDTQSGITGSERLYGCGPLNANASLGATSVAVATEAAADAIFRDGDLIRISNKPDVGSLTGVTEFIRLAASNAVSWNGDLATLTFAEGQSLGNDYLAADTFVGSCIEAGSIEATASDWSLSSASGTYDGWNGSGTSPDILIPDAIGGIEQTWTLTFTSATAFTCVGDTVGAAGGGSTNGADFAPTNATFSRPYFTLPASGWGGTWATGNTLTFKTHPAAYPFWLKYKVPAGCGTLAGNNVVVAVNGESV